MSENMKFDSRARESMARGIDALADAVKVTLGPKGRNVVIDRPVTPRVTKDGVTVAREVKVSDRFESMGVRLARAAAERQNDDAGDGTTTVTVLCQAIAREGLKAVASGVNPMGLKRGIDLAVDALCVAVRNAARPIKNKEDIYRVALISANGDNIVAEKIAEAMEIVGNSGIVTVEEYPCDGVEIEHVCGMMFERGYMDPAFINNPSSQSCDMDNPIIMIYDGKVTRMAAIAPFLEQCITTGRPILLIADYFEEEIMATLVLNRQKAGRMICAVRTPSFGSLKDDLLGDISVITGSPIISKTSPLQLETLKPSDCGSAGKVQIRKDCTIIIDGAGDKGVLDTRIKLLNERMKASTGSDRLNLEVRMASLGGGIAVIKVGGSSEVEIKERKDRVEDAIHATKAAVSGGIVAGGGVALAHGSKCLSDLDVEDRDQAYGIEIVKKSACYPLSQIAYNAGISGEVVVGNILDNYNHDHGYNAAVGEYGNMIDMGVIDPANVVISAIRNAASVAGLLITTECMISEEKKDDRK